MANLILVIIINIFLGTIIWAGINHFNNQSRIELARDRARKQYRNRGRFSSNEVVKQTPVIRRLKINDYGRTYFI